MSAKKRRILIVDFEEINSNIWSPIGDVKESRNGEIDRLLTVNAECFVCCQKVFSTCRSV